MCHKFLQFTQSVKCFQDEQSYDWLTSTDFICTGKNGKMEKFYLLSCNEVYSKYIHGIVRLFLMLLFFLLFMPETKKKMKYKEIGDNDLNLEYFLKGLVKL